MRKPNILYITLYLPLKNVHGGGNRMFEQIKHLFGKYNISVISFLRDWEDEGIAALKPYCREISTVNIMEKSRRSYSFVNPGFIKNYYSREMELLIRNKINSAKPDIVQFEYLPMAQYRLGSMIKARCILTEHQLGFLHLKRQAEIENNPLRKMSFLYRYNRLLRYETKIFKEFDRVIFISGFESAQAKILNSFVSPMGVDTGYFKPDKKNSEDIDLLYTGNFNNYQNKDTIFSFLKYIWPLIKKKRPDTNITIVGVNSEKQLEFLEGGEGITIIGRVGDLREYLQRAKVFIVPARIGAGMKGKILEALAMGRPVISTIIGAEGYEGDILEAIKIVCGSPEEFAEKTVEILDDNALRESMGAIGRREVEKKYGWQSIFSDLDVFYRNLLTGG